jgi:predicted RNase H-like HicB family nuclease
MAGMAPKNKARVARKPNPAMRLRVETEREADGRWIADIPDLPGAMKYGETRAEAIRNVQALALRVLADL